MLRLFLIPVFSLLLGLLLFGCGSTAEDVGVVARVNGEPIYLADLEAKYDLIHLDAVPNSPPSPEKLKKEYLNILKDLIAQRLVRQALEKKKLSVSEEELNKAEAKVRMDYPKGGFEQVLIEEYIDLDIWRKQLVAYLSYQKFLHTVLQPKIVLPPEEIKQYYQKNTKKFLLPPRVVFIRVKGPELDLVKQALQLLDKGESFAKIRQKYPRVEIEQATLPKAQLSENRARVLEKLKPGESSPATAAAVGFEGLLLQKREKERQQTLAEVEAEITQLLMEEKLQKAYVSWLENELADSKISISKNLLESEETISQLADRHREAQSRRNNNLKKKEFPPAK